MLFWWTWGIFHQEKEESWVVHQKFMNWCASVLKNTLNDPRRNFCKRKKLDLSPSQRDVLISGWTVLQRWGYNGYRIRGKHYPEKLVILAAWQIKSERKNQSGLITGIQQVQMPLWSRSVLGPLNDCTQFIHMRADNRGATTLPGMRPSSPAPLVLACSWQDREAEQLLDSSLCSCSYLGI